jgi:hypothetical protein
MNITGVDRPSPIATDFSSDIAAATASGAKIVIHIFSAVAGASFIKQYGTIKPPFACIGINVESQMQEFYASVSGACDYESFLASVGTQTVLDNQPMNPAATPLNTETFWTLYENTYGHAPIYTAWGAYDAIMALNETSYDSNSAHTVAPNNSYGKGWSKYTYQIQQTNNATAASLLIKHIETLGVSDGFAWKRVQIPAETGNRYYRNGILGLFSYTGVNGTLHDTFCTLTAKPYDDTVYGASAPVVRALVVQWQAGNMIVVWPRTWTTSSAKWMIPPWMYKPPDTPEADFAGSYYSPIGSPVPDGVVSGPDMALIAHYWYQVAPWNCTEALMSPELPGSRIDVYDAAVVGSAWGT